MYESCAFFVKVIPKYCIIFDAFRNGLFLITFYYYSLLVCRNTNSFLYIDLVSYNLAEHITSNSFLNRRSCRLHLEIILHLPFLFFFF